METSSFVVWTLLREDMHTSCQSSRSVRERGPRENNAGGRWFSGAPAWRSAGVLMFRNIAGCAGATRAAARCRGACVKRLRLVAGLMLAIGASLAAAQPPAEPQGAAAAKVAAAAPVPMNLRVPSPARAMAAIRYLERRVSGEDDAPLPELGADEAREVGVTIVLRLRGVIVGRGQAFESESVLLSAADEAVGAMRAKMPPARDALQEQSLAYDLSRVQVSLELAGPLIPVQVGTFAEADSTLSPGLDGVALRLKDRLIASSPATMLERNQTAGPALAAAISLATGDATAAIPGTLKGELGTLARERSMTAYRFRVVHVAHAAAGEPAVFLVRGTRPVAETLLTQAEMIRWSDGVATHMMERWRLIGGIGVADTRLLGVIWPMQGRADPDDASAPERALAAVALASYANRETRVAAEARRVAREIVASLELIRPAAAEMEPRPITASAAALALEAIRLLGSGDNAAESLERTRILIGRLDRAYSIEAGWTKGTAMTSRGTIALGLAAASDVMRASDASESERLAALARHALASVYTETGQGSLVTHMPWLLRAEIALAGTGGKIPAGEAMREVRRQVNEHTLTAADVADEADLIGGVIFTQGRASLPTWYGARPLAANAQMLGDERLTPRAERMKELSRLLSGLRFLRQLTLDDQNLWGVTSPEEAQWGVRAALWDQRQPIDASSLTLLAVSETMASLGEMTETKGPAE